MPLDLQPPDSHHGFSLVQGLADQDGRVLVVDPSSERVDTFCVIGAYSGMKCKRIEGYDVCMPHAKQSGVWRGKGL